jgi:large subunit ribosomal protein L32
MAVPKRRTTRSKRNMRRANHDRVSAPTLVACPNCAESMVPHRVCPSCGYYKGREVTSGADSASTDNS